MYHRQLWGEQGVPGVGFCGRTTNSFLKLHAKFFLPCLAHLVPLRNPKPSTKHRYTFERSRAGHCLHQKEASENSSVQTLIYSDTTCSSCGDVRTLAAINIMFWSAIPGCLTHDHANHYSFVSLEPGYGGIFIFAKPTRKQTANV